MEYIGDQTRLTPHHRLSEQDNHRQIEKGDWQMFNISPRIALPLLIAVAVVALAAFAPGPAATPAVEASCGASYGSYYLSSSWETCTWDFGCWANPSEPNNIDTLYQRYCRDKFDENGRYCGTQCYTGKTRRGCCNP